MVQFHIQITKKQPMVENNKNQSLVNSRTRPRCSAGSIKVIDLTSAALEVEGMEAESTAQISSMEILVDASVLLESLRLDESKNCFREDGLLLPDANTCPLIFLQSDPNTLSCSKNITRIRFRLITETIFHIKNKFK